MCNLIAYSDNYSKTSGNLWHCYRDKSALKYAEIIAYFPDDNDSASFKVE